MESAGMGRQLYRLYRAVRIGASLSRNCFNSNEVMPGRSQCFE
jgi:hypothetical protein